MPAELLKPMYWTVVACILPLAKGARICAEECSVDDASTKAVRNLAKLYAVPEDQVLVCEVFRGCISGELLNFVDLSVGRAVAP